jgi:hypothetical protein
LYSARFFPTRFFPGHFFPHGTGIAPVVPTGTLTVTIPAGASSVTFTYTNDVAGTYVLTASPGAGPLSGHADCSDALAIFMPAGLTLNNMLAVTQPGQPPILYVSRTDITNVSIIDVLTDGVSVANTVYQTHTVDSGSVDGLGAQRLKCLVVRVFGEGTITSGTLTVTPDTNPARAETVDATRCTPPRNYPDAREQVILWYAPTPKIVGRCFDATLILTGTGLDIRDVDFEVEIV